MLRTGRLQLVSLILVVACSAPSTSPTPRPNPPEPTSTPAPRATLSPGATAPPASPTPPPHDGDPLVNTVVVTVADKVRVRSEPRVADDSWKYEPLLPQGTSLYVFGGPVSADGYTWYEVGTISVGLKEPGTCSPGPDSCDGISSGWVAAASRAGEPWIAAGPPDCPAVPTDVTTLARMPLGARLACFSGQPITVQARLVECDCDIDAGGYDPSWFGRYQDVQPAGPKLLVAPSETVAPPDYLDWLVVRLDPAGRYPAVLPVGGVVEVTGMFDHPAAMGCLYQAVPLETAGPPAPVSDCRFMFAATSLIASPIALRTAPPDLGCDAIPPPYRQVTFRIDAAAEEQVSALTDTGARLVTYWSAGFRAGSADDPVVRDPSGSVVVADGEVLSIPHEEWPRLHGYFVCPSFAALYVLLDPG
jgi:hypothetical protein